MKKGTRKPRTTGTSMSGSARSGPITTSMPSSAEEPAMAAFPGLASSQ
ncbi:MAG: hypothetical protein GWN18_11855 [Thermoplasmata archaeon]|nr:hypothetical protein [Thermoplasmata archaeon]NIS12746.1 hypothetical protein [Thermoplasmata archaeon]NIS20662.1 hypothetical protein [Thermoplasmata archaeon]NIT78052.1 hypothetical protein [Thermoplasmata archaeon]NIU49732.1 hypothetical protein [Thermoplasmata archaeon]